MPETARHLRESALARIESLIDRDVRVPEGAALVATGSFARKELTPHSDIDLILLVDPKRSYDKDEMEMMWYPFWDAKVRLDYSIRTQKETIALMSEDPKVALSVLDMRFIKGDEELADMARAAVLTAWRRLLAKNFEQILDQVHQRWNHTGSLSDMTHPDLKHGRGGLRDGEFLRALALGQLCDAPDISEARSLILDVRTLLHDAAGRPRDILDPEFAADVANALGMADRYELARAIATSARTIDSALRTGMTTAMNVVPRRTSIFHSRNRMPLDVDVLLDETGIVLATKTNFDDHGLPLRVAACAARSGKPVIDSTWERLEKRWLPQFETNNSILWNDAMRADFSTILGAGDDTPGLITQLDNHGLWELFCRPWPGIRGLLPKERGHTRSVDKHTMEALRLVAPSIVKVSRPDLLLLSVLFHDIAKGRPQPHEELGAKYALAEMLSMGYREEDAKNVAIVVANHSIISQIARKQDPRSPEAVDRFIEAADHDLGIVAILAALTAADAQATGPGVYNAVLADAINTLLPAAITKLRATTSPETVGTPADERDLQPLKWQGSTIAEARVLFDVLSSGAWFIHTLTFTNGAEKNDTKYAITASISSRIGAEMDVAAICQETRRRATVAAQQAETEVPNEEFEQASVSTSDGQLQLSAREIHAAQWKKLISIPEITHLNAENLGAATRITIASNSLATVQGKLSTIWELKSYES